MPHVRISRRVKSFALGMVFPALCAACIVYFGYYTLCGPRGLLALYNTNAQLAVRNEQLQALTGQRDRLARRIGLLSGPNPDPDLIQEIARDQMIGSANGQVDVPRSAH